MGASQGVFDRGIREVDDVSTSYFFVSFCERECLIRLLFRIPTIAFYRFNYAVTPLYHRYKYAVGSCYVYLMFPFCSCYAQSWYTVGTGELRMICGGCLYEVFFYHEGTGSMFITDGTENTDATVVAASFPENSYSFSIHLLNSFSFTPQHS